MVFQMQLALRPEAVPLTRDYLYEKKNTDVAGYMGKS
jgi:hypothetical protein